MKKSEKSVKTPKPAKPPKPEKPSPKPLEIGAPVSHLLVDLDGTLLGNRSISLGVDFARQALSQLKEYTGWRRAVKILIDINKEFGRVSPDVTNDVRVVALFSKALGVTVEEGRRILREHIGSIFPALEKHFYPMPGAREFLEWAHAHYTLTLATNPVWPPDIIEMRVRWAGVDPKIFSNITHVRLMRACKPTREYYEQILTIGGLKPENCLLIGNEVKMDLPATRVGIRVFIVHPNHKSITPLELDGAKALAWKGTFDGLKALLSPDLTPQ